MGDLLFIIYIDRVISESIVINTFPCSFFFLFFFSKLNSYSNINTLFNHSIIESMFVKARRIVTGRKSRVPCLLQPVYIFFLPPSLLPTFLPASYYPLLPSHFLTFQSLPRCSRCIIETNPFTRYSTHNSCTFPRHVTIVEGAWREKKERE